MPRFYFDIRDGHGIEHDPVGLDLPDLDAARTEARRALAEMTQEEINASGRGVICIEIRTRRGEPLVELVSVADEREIDGG